MGLTAREVVTRILAELTPAEKRGAVVYLADRTWQAGSTFHGPRVEIYIPWVASLAFVDGDPLANWTHRARYLLVNPATGEIRSRDAQFPPFSQGAEIRWTPLYRAPSVPKSAVFERDDPRGLERR